MEDPTKDIRPEALRLARVLQATFDLFENDVNKSLAWLGRPKRGLGGKIPLEIAHTESGAQEIIRLLGQSSWGIIS